jgi:TctA family transporter
LIPVVIGLFAIAEMISLAVKGGSIAQQGVNSNARTGVLEGVKDVFRHWGLFLRSSAIGTLIGIIPGLGGDAAVFLAYGQAVQTSKDKESFGKGNVEGVIAPEAANNAKEGGSLVPTLGFGVPGSSSMAIVLGAMLIIGLTPGPEMLTKNVDIVFQLVWTIAIANIIGASIALASASSLAKLTFLRGTIIIPIVLAFCFLGAYTTHNSMGDVVLAVATGLIGYFMKNFGYSRATLILGLVLGHLAEKNLNLSLRLFGSEFWMRPISVVLLVLIVILLASPAFKYWRKCRKGGISG